MRNLLFLTSSYPYYPGEYFVENEIPYLAEAFDTVYVVPLGGDDTLPPRQVPANVVVVEELRNMRKKANRTLPSRIASRTVALKRATRAIRAESVARNKALLRKPGALPMLLRASSAAGQIAPVIGELIIRHRPSVVYSYWLYTEALAASLALDELGRPPPLVARCHRFDLYEEESPLNYCPFQHYLLSRLDAVLPVSNHGTQYLKRKYEASANAELRTFRLGVHGGTGAAPSGDGVARIASCSSLRPVKRVHLIAQALRHVDFPVSWTHIGDGPQMVSLKELASRVEREKSNVHIHFKGEIPNSEVLGYYDSNPVDVFLNVSSSEGIPVSIMEASSRGIPTIATDVGGTSELVDYHNGRGLLSRDVTAEGIAQKLKALLEAPDDEKRSMRRACRGRWEADFNAEKNYRDFCHYLHSLIG